MLSQRPARIARGHRRRGQWKRAARFPVLPFRDRPHPHTARPPVSSNGFWGCSTPSGPS